jgi:D-xylono/L-arabinono-1,4-lactonase
MKPEIIADCNCQIGENPLWSPLEKCLYWTDIPGGKLFRYDPVSGEHEVCYSGEMIGGFTLQTDGSLLLFMERGAIAKWRISRLEYVVREIPVELDNRFNDVITDPAGRVYCGTVSIPTGKRPGRLYRLDTDGTLHLLLDGIGISNGMGFSSDHRSLYFTDSLARKIYLFDYHEDTGTLSNQRLWLQTPEGEGEPDGLTVDADGYVWSARWGDSALYRYAPDGRIEHRIEFPAKKVTSVTFGGNNFREMYVTTALDGNSKLEAGQGAGAVFHLSAGIQGLPEFLSKVMV